MTIPKLSFIGNLILIMLQYFKNSDLKYQYLIKITQQLK